MDEFPRVHDFTEKTGRREGFQYVCRGEICKSIRNENSILRYDRSSRIFFFLGGLVSSSSARYSNFVYDNTIREIIIFVTIVTEKKKKKKNTWRDPSIVALSDYPSRIKIVYTIWGNITYGKEETNEKHFVAKVVKGID